MRITLSMLLATAVFWAMPARSDLRDELDQKQNRLNINQNQLDSAISLHRALSENVANVRAQREGIEDEKDLLTQKLVELERHIESQSYSLSILVQDLDRQRQYVRTMVAQVWQLKPTLSWRTLLSPTKPSQTARQLAWLKHIVRQQQTAINQLEKLLSQKTVLVAQSRVDLEEQARVETALHIRTEELLRLERLEWEKQQQLEDSITDLRRNQAQLTDNVQELQGVIQNFQPGGKDQYRDDSAELIAGSLPWPFQGKIARSASRNSKQGPDGPVQGGLLIIGASGTEVRSVHRGRVVFAGQLKGWGATVIVRHGRDYLSVYAYNDHLTKAPGDFVEVGETLAVLSDFRALRRVEAPVLYFALYRAGETLDPRLWLSATN